VISQSKSTTHSDTRVQALQQAQSGLDAMVGLIRLDASGQTTPPQCIQRAGTGLVTALCNADNPNQLFIYNSDRSLRPFLPDPATPAPHGWCMEPTGRNIAVILSMCASAQAVPASQQWQFTSTSTFVGTTSGGLRMCLAVLATSVVSADNTSAPCSTSARTATWVPTPSVGSGVAGAARNQLVNFSQFGRCADTGGTLVPGASVKLAICGQDAAVPSSQQFTYDSPSGQFRLAGGQTYCLSSAAAGQPATVATCMVTAGQHWTRAVDNTIRDGNGLCLSVAADYATLTASGCPIAPAVPSPQQLWNASTVVHSSTSDISETN
jgi:hypothetical protein